MISLWARLMWLAVWIKYLLRLINHFTILFMFKNRCDRGNGTDDAVIVYPSIDISNSHY